MPDLIPKLSFRFATPADAEALARVQTKAMDAVAKGGLPDPQRTFTAKLEKMKLTLSKDTFDKVLVATLDKNPVGFLVHDVPFSSEPGMLFIDKFYVATPHQHIGTKLFEKFCKIHPEAETLHLKANDESLPIYKKMGFEQTSDYDMKMSKKKLDEWRGNLAYDRTRAKRQSLDP